MERYADAMIHSQGKHYFWQTYEWWRLGHHHIEGERIDGTKACFICKEVPLDESTLDAWMPAAQGLP